MGFLHFEKAASIRRILEMTEKAKEGGALHCISWNVYLPKSHVKTQITTYEIFLSLGNFRLSRGTDWGQNG